MNQIFLDGQEIYLRALELGDLCGDYIGWFNDAEVCQFNSHHSLPYNSLKAESYLKQVMVSDKDLVLAIMHKQDERHIGNISLQNINFINRSAEFAIILGAKDYWHRGYAKAAAQMIINHGFKALNLHRIYCGTSVDNIGMQKLAKHLSMSQEGLRKQALYKNGKYLDVLEYGLLNQDSI